jgi:pimeloyl-ACP methyl ester carboxylesterase
MPLHNRDGVDIWYETTGDGSPLVLIHANPFDHDLWLYQTAHFSTWFRVIGVDIRGYGRSSKVVAPFTLKDMCDDVIGVMDALAIPRAILMGCSVGSGTAILLGLDHPDRFDALVLVGGNSGASDRYRKRAEGYRNNLADYHIEHLRQLVSPAFAQSPLGSHLLNMFVERGPRLSGDAIAQVFMAGNSTDTTPRLPEMRVPTLVINGELDHSLPAGARTASLIPGAVHKVLPGTGHACCIEDPANFDALVLAFLRERKLLPALKAKV